MTIHINAAAFDTPTAAFAVRAERASDIAAREALLDVCFGDNRHARTCQRLRDGRLPAMAFTATCNGRVVGTVRLWHVDAGGVPALVLGPLAVDPSCRAFGIGAALMNHAIAAAAARGQSLKEPGAIVLLGDAPYYARFGFTPAKMAELALPGPFERDRLLGLELRAGALDHAAGVILPTGRMTRDSAPRALRRAA